jgi:hypothetical protein
MHASVFHRPLFAQKMRTDGRISNELRRALEWWVAILQHGKLSVNQYACDWLR